MIMSWGMLSAYRLLSVLVLGSLVFFAEGCFSPSQEQVDRAVQKELQRREDEKKHFFTLMDEYMRDKGFLPKGPSRATSSTPDELKRYNQVFDRKNLDTSPFIGARNAPVTLVEFTDFLCTYCRVSHPILVELVKNEKYKRKIKVVYKFMPIINGPLSQIAAQAAIAAHKLGLFKDMATLLFQMTNFEKTSLISAAASLKMDKQTFEAKMFEQSTRDQIERDKRDAEKLGLVGVPKLFINGVLYEYSLEDQEFTDTIDSALSQSSVRK